MNILPGTGAAAVRRGRAPRNDPVPVPRVDVQPGRRPSERAAVRPRAGLRPGGARPRPVSVDTWGPFASSTRSGGGAAHRPRALGSSRAARGGGLDVDALRFHARGVSDEYAAQLESLRDFLECYHCAVAHPSLTKALDMSRPTATRWRPAGGSRRRSGRRATGAAASTTRPARSSAGSSTSSSRTRSCQRDAGAAEPLDRPRCSRWAAIGRTASSTTSWGRTSTSRGSRTLRARRTGRRRGQGARRGRPARDASGGLDHGTLLASRSS